MPFIIHLAQGCGVNVSLSASRMDEDSCQADGQTQGFFLIYGARHLCRFNVVCNWSVEAG